MMGEKATPADLNPKVKTIACLGGVSLERGVPTEELSGYIRDGENVVWMDVQDPGQEEFALLLEEFGFHPLALEDVQRQQQRAKVDEYKGYLFVVTHAVIPGHDTTHLATLEIDLFIGRNFLVSVHHGRVPALEEAAARWTRGGQMLREGIGFLVYTVMDAVIDAYFPIINAIEEEMSDVEVELFTQFDPEDIQRLLRLKRTLVALRRVLYPLRETFQVFLRPNHPFFSPGTRVYFQDVYDHIMRILDVLDIEREMVIGATDAYLTISSNRLNVTMKRLTVATACVALMATIFGAWGMNFRVIPLSETWWGFWVVFGGTIALLTTVVLICWQRRWL